MSAKPAKSTPVTPATRGISQSEGLQGWTVDGSAVDALREAIELAFNYRGDVTITRKSDKRSIEGYIFDRKVDRTSNELLVRLIREDNDDRLTIAASDILELKFTGKDTASGKTFENWIRKYAQKKLAGEAANIESEPLDSEP